jgi:hypothetical protein
MENSSDRRKRTRVPVQSRIRHTLYQSLGTPVFEENSSVDLSSNGISFETSREYQKGTLVLLDVFLSAEPLKLLVCVARSEPIGGQNLYRVGAELVAIDPLQKKKMAEHLGRLVDGFLKVRGKQKIRTKKKSRKKAPQKKPSKKVHQTTLSKKKKVSTRRKGS